MKYGYARVSTRKQARDGNGLEAQIEQLMAAGCEKVVAEEYTGNAGYRPHLEKLFAEIQEGDMLIVTKLDRLARSVADGAKIIEDLFKRGVAIHILDIGLLDNTPTGRLIIHLFLAIAEFERSMIFERANAGREIARTKDGFREGRRPIDITKKRKAADLIIFQHMSYKEVTELTGLSQTTLVRSVRSRRAELATNQELQKYQ